MQYRSDPAALSKFEYAQCLAAALAWLVIEQQDAVGLTTFDSSLRSMIRPSSNPSHLQQILHALETAEFGMKTAAGPILHELAGRLKKRGVVIVLSDFFDDVPALLAGLKHFRHRRHDVVLFQILDPAELDFPFQGPTQFNGLEQFPEVQADPQLLRRAYRREIDQFRGKLEEGCRGLNMDYTLIRTDESLDVALSKFLAARMAKVK
jgi:uncharacterized protein (DUF58 family)